MDQDQKQSTTNVRRPAQALINGDTIQVNLAATKPDGARMSAGGMFNHLGEAIDVKGASQVGQPGLDVSLLSGSAKPEFPLAKYNELIAQGSREAAEDIQAQYEIDLEAWTNEGNTAIEDAIAAAALDWAFRVHGVTQTDTGDNPYIKPEQVVVKSVFRSHENEPGIFTVQLTPAWG